MTSVIVCEYFNIYEDVFGSHSFTRSEAFSRSPAAVFLAGISLPGFVPAFILPGI
jgi:hypothetical protein